MREAALWRSKKCPYVSIRLLALVGGSELLASQDDSYAYVLNELVEESDRAGPVEATWYRNNLSNCTVECTTWCTPWIPRSGRPVPDRFCVFRKNLNTHSGHLNTDATQNSRAYGQPASEAPRLQTSLSLYARLWLSGTERAPARCGRLR